MVFLARCSPLYALASRARATREPLGLSSTAQMRLQVAALLVNGLNRELLEFSAGTVQADALHALMDRLFASFDYSAAERCPSRLASMHRQRIMRFARENLGDSNLDGNTIAQAVNLSPRHVYQIFDGEDKPLMRWVWSERLARCRHDLEQPALQSRSIGEIAFQWGFSNVSHFSRAFKAEFGVTPRDYRRQVHTRSAATVA